MKKFADIIGHQKVKDHFINAIKNNSIGHAYILEGENGSGKLVLADAFASALLCTSGDGDSCGQCLSCMQADSGNHPDIIHIRHEKSKFSVDEIRALNSDVAIKPYSSDYKIYIIEDAGNMNEAAQNALLKTIEEPPAYAVILLLAENRGTFIPTILSRCVTLSLKPISSEEIKSYLMATLKVPDYLADLAASFSGGNLGRALKFASSEDFIKVKDEVTHLFKYIDDMSFDEVLDAVSTLGSMSGNINEFLDLSMMWFRDVLLYKATKNVGGLCFKDEISAIQAQANTRSFESLDIIIKSFEKAKLRLECNVNFDITMELLILAIKDNK